ncbi:MULTISPECIES: hypothetical protein [unclassified Saccharibacter]|uniref:hypothetical protein n=1 Tax=unclassified Saccharibacter TaxID=2648722 RepID=UPI0013297D37|nr:MULTISPECIES: hypothetical protein [unclassified Saccharibacter]MXV35955.1 hypothetical protein [Saccharibacter sp. EH611]MXV58391.1 hypothetical protein [Saccharibacter sp. EH70]MXV65899.1 hypothetical protein [Saccharibacter sp. EH60]MXV65942.1 hypothetical protein [Saccharibacter sp. EH60]
MPNFAPTPDPRIRRGRIVSTRGGLCIVLKRQKDRVALVPIRKGPENTHRADVHPSWMDAAMLGLKTCDVIRCAPFTLPHHVVYPMSSIVPSTLMTRVWHATCKELQSQHWEDGHDQRVWR